MDPQRQNTIDGILTEKIHSKKRAIFMYICFIYVSWLF